jgi:glutamate/tyrosine decarboxylase-like PLP-dependent enzyme
MPGPLSLPPEDMRRLGYALVDRLVEHHETLAGSPPLRVGDAEALLARIGGPPPDAPGDPEAELAALFEHVLPWGQRADHPALLRPHRQPEHLRRRARRRGRGGRQRVHRVVDGRARAPRGRPDGHRLAARLVRDARADGRRAHLGGSLASLTAFAAARQARLGGPSGTGVVYVTDQTHASLPRAVALLGERTRVLASGAGQRLEPAALRAAVEEDRGDGLQPFCVVATAGTTSTGAIDPLRELHAASRELGLWLHVDGAYGAPAALTPGGAAALDGLGLADSLVVDPHKWLFQPYEIGCVLVREPGLLERVFSLEGAYLRDTAGGSVDFRDRGPELTRGARGLKLWLSVRTFGLDAFRAAIAHGIALAEHAEARLRERDGWEVVTPASLGIVTFRRDGLDDGAHTRLSAATVEDGYAAPSTTVVGDRVVLRLCTINPRTTFEEIDATLDVIERLAAGTRPAAEARLSGPISATVRQPARPSVRSKSALKFCSTSRTPFSPAIASP